MLTTVSRKPRPCHSHVNTLNVLAEDYYLYSATYKKTGAINKQNNNATHITHKHIFCV